MVTQNAHSPRHARAMSRMRAVIAVRQGGTRRLIQPKCLPPQTHLVRTYSWSGIFYSPPLIKFPDPDSAVSLASETCVRLALRQKNLPQGRCFLSLVRAVGKELLGNPRFSQAFLHGETGVSPTPFLFNPCNASAHDAHSPICSGYESYVRAVGIEPTAFPLSEGCSTTELSAHMNNNAHNATMPPEVIPHHPPELGRRRYPVDIVATMVAKRGLEC